jgi:ATP-dependent DNA helicase RecQ
MPAQVLLYYTLKDVVMQGNFIKGSEKPIVGTKKLQRMLQFAEATSCRRKVLLNYFNENHEQDCGNCDICMHPPDFVDGTRIAQMALSGIKRTKERVATTLLIKILRGAESHDVTNRGFHHLKTHGVGAAYSEYEWQHYIAQLINLGLIEIAYDEYLSLKITNAGNKVLFGEKEINVTVPPEKALRSTRNKTKAKVEFNKEVDSTLFDVLRLKRAEIARKQGVPPYIVFNDATLTQMASSKPITLNQMADISGVGDAKLIKYGPVFLELIKDNN